MYKYNVGKTRTEKAAINMFFAGISKVLMLLISFASRSIFIKYLSTEYLGISGLFSNILTLLSFAELGIGNAIIFSMYKPLKEKNIKLLKSLMALYKKSYNIIALVVGVAGVLFIPFLNYIIKDPPNIKENLITIYLLYILNTVISYLFTYKRSILIADQNDYIVSIWQNIFYIVQQILQIFILIYNQNFIQYLLVQVICTLLNNLIIAKIVNKIYPYITEKDVEKLPKIERNRIFKDIKALAISKICGVVMNGTDNIVISKILGLRYVGIISNYSLIIYSINNIIWSTLSGVTAGLGNLNVEENSMHKKDIFDQVYLITYWIYSFVCICLLVLLNPFILLWLGDRYTLDGLTVFALVWIIYTSGVNFPVYSFRTTMGFFEQMQYIYVTSAFINVLLSILMAKWIGLAGVFLATTISRLCTVEIAEGICVYRNGFGISPNVYFKKYLITFFIFLINYFFTERIINLISINGIIGFFIKVIICVIISNFILLVCFYNTKAFKGVIYRLKIILKINK